MAYTNSPLVDYTRLSPNHSGQRNHAIDTITIHCVVGQCTVESLGAVFAPATRKGSSNYGVGKDGRIGMYVEEKNRSWCSSSPVNDHRAITIEVASDTTDPYAVKDAAYNSLIKLVADICKRNGIKKLIWSNDKNTRVNHLNGCNMTVHRDFAATACPGRYLYEHMPDIAAKVNALLDTYAAPAAPTPATPNTNKTVYRVQVGAFKEKSNAYKLESDLRAAGYSTLIVHDATAYKVQVGAFNDKANADKLAEKLKAAGYSTYVVSNAAQAPAPAPAPTFAVGDKVKCKPGVTKYSNGVAMAKFVTTATLYVRAVEQNGKVLLVSTEKTKQVYTGRVNASDMVKI